MKKDKLHQQIKTLNEANKFFDQAIKKIEDVFVKNNDIDLFLYRIKKAVNSLNKVAMKKLEKEDINRAFNKLKKNLFGTD